MRRSYRTTPEILNFATLLYRERLADEKDDDILVPDLLDMPNGAFPQLIPLTRPQDGIVRVATRAGQRLVITCVGGAAGSDRIDPFSGTKIWGSIYSPAFSWK